MCTPLICVRGGRRRCPRCRGGLRMGHTCALVSWGEQEAAVEEIEVGPAKHLALEHLEAIDMALDRAIGPGHGHPSFDGVIVLVGVCVAAAQKVGLARSV